MKKIHLYILFLGLFSMSSCDLETEPLTTITDTNFYSSTDDAWTALVGCYDGLQVATGGIGGLSFPVASEVMSDNCFGGTGNSDGFGFQAVDEFDISRSPVDADLYNNNWVQYYKALYRCNVLLEKLDQINWEGNEDLRITYESETKFIRAYIYFEMVKLWGNIPLITVPTSENIPQAPASDVYTLIAEDLLFAANGLAEVSYSSVESGRVTKWAAKSMLARVYLYYTGYYGESDLVGMVSKSQALGHLEDVISKSGHSLVPDFSNLWPAASVDAYAGEDNSENVFSIKYTHTSDYNGNTDGNHWMVMFGIREFSSYPYGNGWGVTVTQKLWDSYTEEDTRRAASIISIEDEEIEFTKIGSQREYTGYYNKKYSPMVDEEGNSTVIEPGGESFQINQFQDYTVMRYADVLLMAAELGSPSAQSYFDAVRQRAYQSNFSPRFVSEEALKEERHLEFALEGIRYWDLLRQGISVAAAEIAETTTILNGGIEETKTIESSYITNTNGLSQIPNTQITLSDGVLQQNAGW